MAHSKNIAILGSTGSIGRSALEVARMLGQLNVVGLSGRKRLDILAMQALEFCPNFLVAADAEFAASFVFPELPDSQIMLGAESLVRLASEPDVDVVLAAIVGIAGLESTWAAIENGKRVALANKETLVVAGQAVMDLAQKTGAEIIPVDSEHSAVFQAIKAGRQQEVERIVLTASGGPFRDFDLAQLKCVTVEQALAHPTWNMGQKISVDSATMMNKALEIIEARWLFGLDPDQIEVIIHPQSIIHSLVEFVDGSVVAQMSPPDMKLPIQYALTFPDRVQGPSPKLDLTKTMLLELTPADFDRFPALQLGFEVARAGGTAGAVLNAANEAAVDAFLKREISFTDIVVANREILAQHNFEAQPSLGDLIAADRWARTEMSKWIVA
jgi:1-deoxy-D-xylulose-5-phosphate reductoisomerase